MEKAMKNVASGVRLRTPWLHPKESIIHIEKIHLQFIRFCPVATPDVSICPYVKLTGRNNSFRLRFNRRFLLPPVGNSA